MDAYDQAYFDSIVGPDPGVPIGLVSVLAWLDADGNQRWTTHVDMAAPASSVLGLIEMAKAKFLGELNLHLADLDIEGADEDDEGL